MLTARFARLEERVDRAVARHLSNVVAIYQQAGSPQLVDVLGIFSEEGGGLEDVQISTAVPYLDLLRADVPALSTKDHFTFGGDRYKVAEIVPGGGGRVVIRLHKVT